VAICAAGFCLCVPSGCQIGRRWFQMDSNSRMPFMGIELRADAETGKEGGPESSDVAGENEILAVEHTEPGPRRGLRDWLRLPGGEERIPLPLASEANAGVDAPSTGPQPEFE
jgi:hypothetical protein